MARVAVSPQLLVPFLEEPRIELLALAAGPAPRELRVSAPPPRPRSRAHEQRVVLAHTHMLLASLEAGRLPSRSLCLLAAHSLASFGRPLGEARGRARACPCRKQQVSTAGNKKTDSVSAEL